MKLIGNKDLFGVELGKAALAYQLAVYVQGNDILQFKKEGVIYAYKWRNCQDIIEWIHENMKYILNDDEFPLVIIRTWMILRNMKFYKIGCFAILGFRLERVHI